MVNKLWTCLSCKYVNIAGRKDVFHDFTNCCTALLKRNSKIKTNLVYFIYLFTTNLFRMPGKACHTLQVIVAFDLSDISGIRDKFVVNKYMM